MPLWSLGLYPEVASLKLQPGTNKTKAFYKARVACSARDGLSSIALGIYKTGIAEQKFATVVASNHTHTPKKKKKSSMVKFVCVRPRRFLEDFLDEDREREREREATPRRDTIMVTQNNPHVFDVLATQLLSDLSTAGRPHHPSAYLTAIEGDGGICLFSFGA